MKDKEKQIEELANDIYSLKSCDTSFEENCKLLAYDLFTLGWIKSNEDSVVISKEELSKKYVDRDIYDAEIEYRKVLEGRVSEKTARDIFAKERDLIYSKWKPYITMNDLIEFAEQFGVELKD